MAARMPGMSARPLPRTAREVAEALEKEVAGGKMADGWIRVERPISDSFLFVHKGKAYAAGALEAGGRFGTRTFAQFFSALDGNNPVEICATDTALLLCAAVPFRKAPSIQVNVAGLKAPALLAAIAETESDAVLLVHNDDAVSLAFCHKGTPVQLYAARAEAFPEAPTVAERIARYAESHPRATIDIYDDVKLGPATGAGQPFASYVKASKSAAMLPPALLVRLGGRIVFRYEIEGTAVIGRGGGCEIPLDNLSVSRNHARVKRSGDTLIVEDLGSENGIVLKGKKVPRAALTAGDEILIGKYTLTYVRPGSEDEKAAAAAPAPKAADHAPKSLDETIAVGGRGAGQHFAHMELDGQTYKFRGMIFTIGSAADAHLPLRGFLVAKNHARVLRDPAGTHLITHVAGLRAMRVNGKKTKESLIVDGDVITIAGNRIVFRLAAAEPIAPPKKASSIGPKRT